MDSAIICNTTQDNIHKYSCSGHERVNVLPMSHVRGGESQGYMGLGILIACSIRDAKERG